VAGSVADSILGATVQRKGVCVVCGKPSESPRHDGQPTRVISGVPFVENNIVNLLASIVGAVVALGLVRVV